MTEGIWVAVIGGVFTVAIAVIETRNAKERKKSEHRAEVRQRESRLSMEMMSASCKLGVVTAKAVTGMHTNGDVEEAMKAAENAQKEYDVFLRDTASYAVSKN